MIDGIGGAGQLASMKANEQQQLDSQTTSAEADKAAFDNALSEALNGDAIVSIGASIMMPSLNMMREAGKEEA